MRVPSVFILTLLLAVAAGGEGDAKQLANGYGAAYDWAPSLEAALEAGERLGKPIMLVLHKSWCHACKTLGPKFAADEEIRRLSEYFVMVNLIDDDDRDEEKKYVPDGSYIPRILFMSPDGEVLQERYNELGNPNHKFFYHKTNEIVITMKKVLTQLAMKNFEDEPQQPDEAELKTETKDEF